MDVGDGHVAVGIYRCAEKWQTSRQCVPPACRTQPATARLPNITHERGGRNPLAGADLDRDGDAHAVKLGAIRAGLEPLAVDAPVLDRADDDAGVRDGDAVGPQPHVHVHANVGDVEVGAAGGHAPA